MDVYLILYIIGYVLSYYIMKTIIINLFDEWGWIDIFVHLFMCLFFPITLLMWIISYIIIKINNNNEPPKWL